MFIRKSVHSVLSGLILLVSLPSLTLAASDGSGHSGGGNITETIGERGVFCKEATLETDPFQRKAYFLAWKPTGDYVLYERRFPQLQAEAFLWLQTDNEKDKFMQGFRKEIANLLSRSIELTVIAKGKNDTDAFRQSDFENESNNGIFHKGKDLFSNQRSRELDKERFKVTLRQSILREPVFLRGELNEFLALLKFIWPSENYKQSKAMVCGALHDLEKSEYVSQIFDLKIGETFKHNAIAEKLKEYWK